ncbi:MAG TPA: type II CAAX endopeptidase family protein [Xanthobacteraceae bacterium]|nr:type II CAAX endopeptidase family protein [Xanthobacteraceae bacterium]
MKVLSRWATVGYALFAIVLTVVLAGVAARFMMPATASLVSMLVPIITLMLACRRSGSNVLAYLGLDIPRWKHVAITVAGLAVWVVFLDALFLALGHDLVAPNMLEIYRSARADGSLIWWWLTIVVATPIGEELLFRGFVFPSFVDNQRDAIPNIVLISIVWSLGHFQYDWLGITSIFVVGVLLGLVRWRTGSTTLTILLHMLNNLESWIETAFALG